MSRPLTQYGVGQLGTMFLEGKRDVAVLKALEHELQYRQVPRAVALLAEVRAALKSGATAPNPRPVSPQAIEPIAAATVNRIAAGATQPLLEGLEPSRASELKTGQAAAKPPAAKATRPQLPAISLDEACKVLKTVPTASWESIEQSRRLLVQQSHPSLLNLLVESKRDLAEADAKRANAACAAIFASRFGR